MLAIITPDRMNFREAFKNKLLTAMTMLADHLSYIKFPRAHTKRLINKQILLKVIIPFLKKNVIGPQTAVLHLWQNPNLKYKRFALIFY